MVRDVQEEAAWVALVYDCGIMHKVSNEIISRWCFKQGRFLKELFAAGPDLWRREFQLGEALLEKLEQGRERLPQHVRLIEGLTREGISLLKVVDPEYPALIRKTLTRTRTPAVLFYLGDLEILKRQTFAIIGARNATPEGLNFTREAARWLSNHAVNVISGNARGVDREALEGALSATGYTTVVLPHGLRKLSAVQLRNLRRRTDSGNALLISQFHPDAPWLVSRAMERNKVVTALAQLVIVADADIKGGTMDGATAALKQRRPLFVRAGETLAGNILLIERGGFPLHWPASSLDELLPPLLDQSIVIQQQQSRELLEQATILEKIE